MNFLDRYKNVDLIEESIIDELLKTNDNCICEGLEGDTLIFYTYNLMDEDTQSPYIEKKRLKFNCFTGEEMV